MTGETAAETAMFRCSAASRALGDPLEGTASTVGAFLLLETPGPWGVEAVRDSRLPDEVRARLGALKRGGRVRPLLIRRPHGRRSRRPRVFTARVDGGHSWVETTELDDPHELLELDLAAFEAGGPAGLTAYDGPLFLVCTHGRHDACCAELGRPLTAALAEVAREATWEVSHIGGDRFAANVLALPHGLYYGRLSPAEAGSFVEVHRAGRLDLDHLRGRSSYPFAVQAADIYLRRQLGIDTVEPLALQERSREGSETVAVFMVSGVSWAVRVQTDLGDPRRLTCRSRSDSSGFSHRLLSIRKTG